MENVRKHRNIKLVATERSINYSVTQPNYYTTKFFTEHLIEMRKIQILTNKACLFRFINIRYEQNCNACILVYYVKPKYGENAKLCYMDTDSSIVHVKIKDIYKDIAKDVETRFDTSNFELDRPLPKGKNKKK